MSEVGSLTVAGNLLPTAGRGEPGNPLPGLSPGDLVEGELVETLGRGDGILRVAGRLFRALHPEGLSPGLRLSLKVVSTGPPIVLKLPDTSQSELTRLLSPPPRSLALAVQTLLEGSSKAPPESIEGRLLTAARQLMGLPAEPKALGQALARWVANAGLFHEAALAQGREPGDLKGILLKLLASLPRGELGDAVETVLGHLQAHQARSLLEGTLVVPLVLPWGDETVQGDLRLEVEDPANGRREEGSRSLHMRLQMPNLGPVEVRLRWGTPGVSVRVALESRFLETARGRLGALAEALTGRVGVRLVDLQAEALPPSAPKMEPGLIEVIA